MIQFLKNLFVKKPDEQTIAFSVDIPEWESGNAHELHAFFNTPTGSLFIQHLKKHQIEMNEWAVDTSQEVYENMKFRGCAAYGAKLKMDKILSMSRPVPESKNRKLTEEELTGFFNRRMGIFKSNK